MIKVSSKSKLQFHWKVNPYDYSKDKEMDIIEKASKKYSVPKNRIEIIPDFIMLNDKGETINISNDLIANIQDPQFQLKLFKEYLDVNQIENYDFETLKKIDSEINSSIDYDVYDKFKRYSIKWIKWSNFLSYGKDNFFDFTSLRDLVLLNGEPSNQSGKTTFAIDLLHFLLFGKTNKASVQEKIFNKWLKDETEVIVEGCLEIEGEEYIIKRTLSRPQLTRRTSKSKTTQKVEYYKIIGGETEELAEYEDKNDENSAKTNKVIKETIGNESDFDLIICATSKNLTDLIEKKDTERGKLLSRWIGLLPIEQKFEIAKERFNSSVKPYLLSNRYNVETLARDKEAFKMQIGDTEKTIESVKKNQEEVEKKIKRSEEVIYALLTAKQEIDSNIMKIDITTLDREIQNLTDNGIAKKKEIDTISSEIEQFNIGNFSTDEYDALNKEKVGLVEKRTRLLGEYKFNSNQIDILRKGEYCPTCGKKLDNVNHDAQIKGLEYKNKTITQEGKEIVSRINDLDAQINSMAESRDNFLKKSNLMIKKSACEVQIEQMRNTLKDKIALRNEYNKNKEAIDKNNNIDLQLRNEEVILNGNKNTRTTNAEYIVRLENDIMSMNKNIMEIDKNIEKIKEEEKIVRHWKIYLDMIGKNGIVKMVLRKALPIINAQVSYLLSDVCDFDVEISINERNEVNFFMISDGEVSDISGGSGFEQTAAALALRFVLAKNSVLPKLSYIVLDEVFGLVADENLERMRALLDKVKDDYQSIIIVSHKDVVKSWCNTIITVGKEGHISRLSTQNK